MKKPIHDFALRLYDSMAEHAKESDDGHFHGSITAVFRELGSSNSSYTPITRLLLSTGAITCLQRGARAIESVYALGERPTEEELLSVALTTKAKPDTLLLQQQVNDIDKRIGRLDIVEALASLEARVSKLESN